MDILLKRIWVKLRGKPRMEEVKAAIDQAHKITLEQVNQIAAYLQVVMDDDPQFAAEIRMLAQENCYPMRMTQMFLLTWVNWMNWKHLLAPKKQNLALECC